MKALLRTLVATVAIVPAAAIGLVVLVALFVTTTPYGARLAIERGAAFAPGEVEIGRVGGSVWTGLVLEDVRYDSETASAALERLVVEPELGALADGRIALTRLAAVNGFIQIRESDETSDETRGEATTRPDSNGPMPLPELPEFVTVDSLQLDNVRIEAPGATLAVGHAAGTLDRGTLTVERLEITSTEPMPVSAVLALRLTSSELAVDWTELTWPAAGIRSPYGRLTASAGARDDSTAIGLEARLEGEALPTPGDLSASALLLGATLEVEALEVEALGGTATAAGTLDLAALGGQVMIEFDGIDPSRIDERLEGEIGGQLEAIVATTPELDVDAEGAIGGDLGGRVLEGRFDGRYADGSLTIDAARIALETSAIELAGAIAPETTDIAFSAMLPALQNWYPAVSGSFEASGTIVGPTDNPTVEASLEASGLALEDSSVPPIERLTATIAGSLAAHALDIAAESELGQLAVALEQGYAGGRLTGTIRDSVLQPAGAGVWNLDAPADYSAARSADINLEPACYVGPEDAGLCIAAMGGELSVAADGLPNTLAEPWLPSGLALSGTTDVELTLALQGPLRGSVTIEEQSLGIGLYTSADPAANSAGALGESDFMELLDLADLTLNATIGPDGLEAEWGGGPDSPEDTLSGRMALSPLAREGRLDGSILLDIADIAVIGAFVEGVENLEGAIEAELVLAGTPDMPVITGQVIARDVGAALPPLGIELSESRLAADIDGLEELAVEGQLCSIGCAQLTGLLTLPLDDAWRAELSIQGEGVEVIDLPDMRAVVTPDLVVSATPDAVQVTGDVTVAEAAIEIADLPPAAVRPVSETVVYGREPAAEDEAGALPIPLLVNVEASLGEVRFEGLGLTAELDGTLDVEYTADGDLLVQGQAVIEEGVFSAYGQQLTIERGLLIFSGPPDNPALDIRATRSVEGSEVGLLITGTANDPRSEVFSSAGLSESEALARLLTGRSLETAGEAPDPEALQRAALGLGIRRALPTLGRIGEALGLDELGVDSPGAEEGAIVAGRALSEDVYLRYKHGLFDEFSGLELIYRITEKFRLRTETGTAQAIDLIYEVERAGEEREEDIAEVAAGFDETSAAPINADETSVP